MKAIQLKGKDIRCKCKHCNNLYNLKRQMNIAMQMGIRVISCPYCNKKVASY